jgi:acyl-CoA thioesterase-1
MQSLVPSIICFGDSLTVGFRSPTIEEPDPANASYAQFLQERLKDRALIKISGVCGEQTSDMLGRFSRDVLAHKPWAAVILGGSNDLGWHVPAEAIFRNLRIMYEQASERGIQVTAVTVPSIRGADDYIQGRHEVNRLIVGHCEARSLACVDLFTATAEPKTGRLAEPYSNDGLHLTVSGYRLLADLLYQRVFHKTLPR